MSQPCECKLVDALRPGLGYCPALVARKRRSQALISLADSQSELSPCVSDPLSQHTSLVVVVFWYNCAEESQRTDMTALPSADFQQFDIEEQRGIGWNISAGALLAVAQFGRDDQLAFAADLHAGHALIPAFDDFAGAQRE